MRMLSTAPASFVTEEPAEGLYYATSARKRTADGVVTVEGFKVLPANWADSYYWTFDALSNLMEFGNLTDDQKAAVNAKMAELQNDCYAAYGELQTAVAAAADNAAAAKAATEISAKTAEKVHTAVVELVNGLVK